MSGRQLSRLVDMSSLPAVLAETRRLFDLHYGGNDFSSVESHFHIIQDLFAGDFPGYRKCNTEYHNFFHTTDTFLAVMRFIDGRNLNEQAFVARTAALLLSASLFHDAGYIQKDWDTFGTGAKYTREHVARSKEFVVENSRRLELHAEEVARINRFIDSTGLEPALVADGSLTEEEKTASVLLGAADLVAQMSDRVYLEKLLFLYYEFREAGIEGYDTEFDIINKTLDFYAQTERRLLNDYRGIHRAVVHHFRERYGIDADLYQEAIEHNIDYIHRIIDDARSNFRAKLHRVSL